MTGTMISYTYSICTYMCTNIYLKQRPPVRRLFMFFMRWGFSCPSPVRQLQGRHEDVPRHIWGLFQALGIQYSWILTHGDLTDDPSFVDHQ